MDEEKFDFENLKVYQKALEYVDPKLRTPVRNGFKPFPTELRTIFRRKHSFDEILLQLTQVGLPAQPVSPRKVLFCGERAEEISSYVAGWMAGKGIEVIVLDGANRFNSYTVSSFARRTLISPEKLLKSIRIARAFTCYQMATLMGEQLISLLRREEATEPLQRRWVILLGPLTTFLDEDVPEREVRPLFERSLKKIEEMALKGIPFLSFQSSVFSENPPFPPFSKGRRRRPEPDYGAGRMRGLRDSKRVYLTRRLFQFSNLVWKISLEDQELKVILEKEIADSRWLMADSKQQIENSRPNDSVIPV